MLTLKSRDFRKEREGAWGDLERLITAINERGADQFPNEVLERIPLLYRSVLSSLSVARSIALDRALEEYLENLALRSFLTVYAQPLSPLKSMVSFLSVDLPRAVRRIAKHVGAVTFVLVLGAVSGYVLVMADAGWYSVLVPASMAGGRNPTSTKKELLAVIAKKVIDGNYLLNFANYLFSNNTLVSLMMFGLGFAGGIPTLALIFGNGLMLGAMLALYSRQGLLGEMAGWLSIHGFTELTAIVLFGAAGLRLGELVLFPGKRTRKDALAEDGPVTGEVAVGGVLMLLVAAFLEGVMRQTIIDTNQRLAIGFGTFVIWVLYFSLAGRGRTAGGDGEELLR